MRGNGPKAGWESRTYERAGVFFRERQLQGLPQRLPASARKKVKTADKTRAECQLLSVPADVELSGEEQRAVPVYETCDTMRRQIRTVLKKDGVTQAAYLRAIAKCGPGEPSVQPRVLRDFLSQRGPAIGCKSLAFYGSYVFFKKRRVEEGKPKSKFRQEMEDVHGAKGMDIEMIRGPASSYFTTVRMLFEISMGNHMCHHSGAEENNGRTEPGGLSALCKTRKVQGILYLMSGVRNLDLGSAASQQQQPWECLTEERFSVVSVAHLASP